VGVTIGKVSHNFGTALKILYIEQVVKGTPMKLEVNGYAIDTLKQALQESSNLWQQRIDEAERGERPNLSIDGARMMQDDLRELLEQIKWQTGG